MKVLGQLESAQLENLSSPPTPTPQGRVYMDTTLGYPQVYTGARWAPLLLGQTSTTSVVDNGTTTQTMTIDWSKGLTQSATLGAHTVFSFINPVPASTHTLIVKQALLNGSGATTVNPWKYQFNMPDMAPRRTPFQPQGVLQSSAVGIHSFLYSAGIQPAYVSIAAPLPYLAPTTSFGLSIDLTPDAKNVTLGNNATPFNITMPLLDAGDRLVIGQFGNINPANATFATAALALKFSSNGAWAALGQSGTPYLKVYGVTNGAPVGTALSPVSPPPSQVNSVDWNPSSECVAVGTATAPYLTVYPMTTAGVGVKYPNPFPVATSAAQGVAWSPFGDFVALSFGASPYFYVYPFDMSSGYGTVVPNPSVLPAAITSASSGRPRGIAWRPQGDWIAIALDTSPYFYLVPFNRGTGTFGTPQTIATVDIPAAAVAAVSFSPDGSFLAVGYGTSPYISVYAFTSSGYTSGKLAFDGGNPGSSVNDLVWHPSGEYIFTATTSTPYMVVLPAPRPVRNYLKLSV